MKAFITLCVFGVVSVGCSYGVSTPGLESKTSADEIRNQAKLPDSIAGLAENFKATILKQRIQNQTKHSDDFSTAGLQTHVNSTIQAGDGKNNTDDIKSAEEPEGNRLDEEREPTYTCRSSALNFAEIPEIEEGQAKNFVLCGSEDPEEDRCYFACVSGGFFRGVCTNSNQCFCYRHNPDNGFLIQKRQPIMRTIQPKDANPNMKTGSNDGVKQNPVRREITLVSEDYVTGHVDIGVNLNMEWDFSHINDWMQSFNIYDRMKCDHCLCKAGCSIYGFYSGYCTPKPESECMCAAAASLSNITKESNRN